jgi:hypothetical protein
MTWSINFIVLLNLAIAETEIGFCANLFSIIALTGTHKKELAAESIGLEAIAEGFRQITTDDFDNMNKQLYIYDALYAYCKGKISQNTSSKNVKSYFPLVLS